MHSQQKRMIEIYGKDPETLDEVAEAMIAVISEKHTILGLAWNISYKDGVSNSHHKPLGGVSNWCARDKTLPCAYPGFEGRVWVRFFKEASFDFSPGDALKEVMGHAGTGGAGDYGGPWASLSYATYRTYGHNRFKKGEYPRPNIFSWDFRIYLSDFPALEQMIARDKTWHSLTNKLIPYSNQHQFEWQVPAVKAADDDFIAKFQYEEKRKQERRYLKT